MEIFNSYVHEKCRIYLGPFSLFCMIFNNLNWESFAEIAEKGKTAGEGNDLIPARLKSSDANGIDFLIPATSTNSVRNK